MWDIRIATKPSLDAEIDVGLHARPFIGDRTKPVQSVRMRELDAAAAPAEDELKHDAGGLGHPLRGRRLFVAFNCFEKTPQ